MGGFDVQLRGGEVVDGTGAQPRRADVGVVGDRVADIDDRLSGPAATVIDCAGRYLLPGLIDAHAHAEAAVFEPFAAQAYLRQGVTTVLVGQDGVSFAPGNGEYATEYFAAINGPHPSYRGSRVADLLSTYDASTPLNVAYLVPHGTVRNEVMGRADRPPTGTELDRMTALVTEGMADGAVGLSSGLDYTPGLFADAAELAALCRPVAAVGGVYVTHMRGGYETNASAGVAEVVDICQRAAVAGHVSHYHGPGDQLAGLIDDADAAGVGLTFDSYPYRRGFTLLGMPMLPPELLGLSAPAAAERLANPQERARIVREWLPQVTARPDMGDGWAARATIAHVAADTYRWVEGRTLSAAAAQAGLDPGELGLRMLSAAGLSVSAIFALPPTRGVDDIRTLLRHPRHLAGSDGIFVGTHPHPRAWGAFARLLGRHTREWGDYTWGEAAAHAAGHAARRFGLRGRGRLVAGAYADIAVVDPAQVSDEADYPTPRRWASGVADVLVNGVAVLRDGALTGAAPGRAVRHRRD